MVWAFCLGESNTCPLAFHLAICCRVLARPLSDINVASLHLSYALRDSMIDALRALAIDKLSHIISSIFSPLRLDKAPGLYASSLICYKATATVASDPHIAGPYV